MSWVYRCHCGYDQFMSGVKSQYEVAGGDMQVRCLSCGEAPLPRPKLPEGFVSILPLPKPKAKVKTSDLDDLDF